MDGSGFCGSQQYRRGARVNAVIRPVALNGPILTIRRFPDTPITMEKLIALGSLFRALSSWVGFKTIQIPFEVQEREIGTSKWSFWSLVKYALRNITSFSGAPMQVVTILGWFMLIPSFAFSIEALYRYFSGTAVEGFTTVIILLCWIGSILMISLGIIGHYISRIYEEIKARPRYLISRRCGYEREAGNAPGKAL